jgi:hypothetical protein
MKSGVKYLTMKFLDRKPRNEPSLANYNYYDHETVVQDDGQIAAFQFENHKRDDGWKFVGYKDKYGFSIWDDKDRTRMWDESVTMEKHLVYSTKSGCSLSKARQEFGSDFELGEDEIIIEYEYGGPLSGRGGYFIVNKNNPTKILRSIQTWLS